MKALEAEAAQALRSVLAEAPLIQGLQLESAVSNGDREHDIVARFEVGGRPQVILCEVKASGQPRLVRSALHQLRAALDHWGGPAATMVVAPYLSEEARALCRRHDASYLDFEGNCRIALDTVFIERTVPTKPAVARRDLKSLFKPKSAQVLRVLLRSPQRAWKVVDLAAEADVSLGHVSNVRTALIDREWASATPEGLHLTAPGALLDTWRDQYEQPPGTRLRFYTALHGTAFDKSVRGVLGREGPPKVLLASFSAAQWIAPFARQANQFLYADQGGLDRLREALHLSTLAKGENVTITQLDDDGLFRDVFEPAPGVFTTSPVQTYLDLAQVGERGREAADHLRRERLAWPT